MVNEPISEVEPTTPEVEPEKSELPQLVLPLADMTPEERFRATARLIFLAPDVPPMTTATMLRPSSWADVTRLNPEARV